MIIKYLRLIISSLCLIVLLINIDLTKESNEISVNKNIEKIKYNEIINNLKDKYNNNDIVGILKIDTELEVLLLQTENNDYYLNHTINKEESIYGAIFLDYRVNIDNSKKLLIYGHSSTKKSIAFNILENYYEKKYYDNHKYISLTTSKEEKIYEIFSIYVETKDFSYMDINFIDNEDYYKHVSSLKNKSIYNTGIELNEKDEILILQTCSNHIDYKEHEKRYLLIISRRIK